jgi:hypothetical protein
MARPGAMVVRTSDGLLTASEVAQPKLNADWVAVRNNDGGQLVWDLSTRFGRAPQFDSSAMGCAGSRRDPSVFEPVWDIFTLAVGEVLKRLGFEVSLGENLARQALVAGRAYLQIAESRREGRQQVDVSADLSVRGSRQA